MEALQRPLRTSPDFTSNILSLLLLFFEFKRIYSFLFALKSPETHRFYNHFRGNRNQLIRLNALNIGCEIWRRDLNHIFGRISKGREKIVFHYTGPRGECVNQKKNKKTLDYVSTNFNVFANFNFFRNKS